MTWLTIASSVAALIGYFAPWLTIYWFKDVLAVVENSREDYKPPHFTLVYILLAMILAYPLISSYFLLTTGKLAPVSFQLFGFGLMFIGMVGVFKITYDLIAFSGIKFFETWMWVYAAGVFLATSFFALKMDFTTALAQYLLMLSQVIFGFFLFAVAKYTREYGSVKIPMGEAVIERKFVLYNAFLFAGVLLPAHGALRAFSVATFSLPVSQGNPLALEALDTTRILGNIVLLSAGGVAAWAMLQFKRIVVDFCVKINAVEYLKKGRAETPRAKAKNHAFKRRNS